MRVELSDLCYRCRKLPAMNGMSVEDFLETAYSIHSTDPEKYLKIGGDTGVVVILNNAIVMGDGCTTCGRKILDWARELRVIR